MSNRIFDHMIDSNHLDLQVSPQQLPRVRAPRQCSSTYGCGVS